MLRDLREQPRIRRWREGPGAASEGLILSVHVPKTAGSTFRFLLERLYGPGLALDYGVYGDPVGSLDGVRVIHGHFPVRRYLERYPGARVVTWLRDPVDRIASYYGYWLRNPDTEGNPNHRRMLDEKMSIVEFAEMEAIRDEVATVYFEAFDFADAWFVGLTEHFDEDLADLSRLLGWPSLTAPPRNVAPNPYPVAPEERRALERILAGEIALHRWALEVRARRRPEP